MSEFEDENGEIRPASWFGKHGRRPRRMDGLTDRQWKKLEEQDNQPPPPPEFCPKSEDGKHVPDPHTICRADVDEGEGCVVDVSCKLCGQSGAFKIEDEDIDW